MLSVETCEKSQHISQPKLINEIHSQSKKILSIMMRTAELLKRPARAKISLSNRAKLFMSQNLPKPVSRHGDLCSSVSN